MSKIYLPHASQFDLVNENLAKIANAVSSDMDISTWAGIQKAVRVGVAPDLIPVGTQLSVTHSVYGDILFDVVAHDLYKSRYDKNAHTMTLMSHNLIRAMHYDRIEAFYYADTALSAGTYNFTIPTTVGSWAAGTYNFTLTKILPVGGQLCINGSNNTTLTSLPVVSYENQSTTTTLESVAITSGSNGTSLGTFGTELNRTERASYGSDNYKESAIRQFLNSSAEKGSVWTPQTKFDRPPHWESDTAGFLNGIDTEFSAVLGEVVIPCHTNDKYEYPYSTTGVSEKYIVKDKVYLPSQREIFGESSSSIGDDSTLFPYYYCADATDRIKTLSGVATTWWTRSPAPWGTNVVKVVTPGGLTSDNYASGDAPGVAPVCTIV